MIEIRKTTQKEKAKHSNMAYVIDLGHTKQWFTEKALVELLDKLHKVVNENGLLQRVGESVCDHDWKPCEHKAVWEFDKCTKCGKIR